MKKAKIKTLPFIKEFADYFVRRARRVLKLKLKNGDYDHMGMDVHPDDGTIWVWVYGPKEIVGRAQFNFDGRCYHKVDNREEQGVTLKVK